MASKEMQPKVTEELNSLTAHGIARIASAPSKTEKIIWLILWLTSTGAVIYLAYTMIKKHYEFKTFISTKTKVSNELTLPAISFCDSNYYDDWQTVRQTLNPLPQSCSQSFNDSLFANQKDKLYFNKACDMFLARNGIQACSLNHKTCSFPKDFKTQKNMAMCYTLNRNSHMKHTIASGHGTGLQMMLYFNESDIPSNLVSEHLNPLLNDNRGGLYVSIHDQRSYVAGFIDDGIKLPVGYHTLIGIKKFVIKRKPSPFPSNCVMEGKEKYLKVFPGKHNIKLCLMSCFVKTVYEKCGFLMNMAKVLMEKEFDVQEPRNLTPVQQEMCYRTVYDYGFKTDNCNCSVPCEEIRYQTEVMRKPWPQKWQTDKFHKIFAQAVNKPNLSHAMIKENFLKVSIYYDDFITRVLEEEEAYTVESLVSDFGGQLGLFLGMSIISMIEMIHLTITLIREFLIRKPKIRVRKVKVEDNADGL